MCWPAPNPRRSKRMKRLIKRRTAHSNDIYRQQEFGRRCWRRRFANWRAEQKAREA